MSTQEEKSDEVGDGPRVVDVIVVGAGVAGLYAATILHHRHPALSITILEASGRCGGRLYSNDEVAPYPIELGAEWVHGSKSALYNGLRALDKKLVRQYQGFVDAFSLDGQIATYPPCADKDVVAADKFNDRLYKYKGPDVTIAEHLQTHGITPDHRAWHCYEAWIGTEFGSSLSRVGMKSAALMEDLWEAGEANYVVRGSYLSSIIQAFDMWAALPLVQFNKQVVAIDHSQAVIEVLCADGTSRLCRAIIVAAPLPALKTMVFQPPLPPRMTTALGQLAMDAGMKISIFFAERFWGERVCEITFRREATFGWDPGFFKWGVRGDQLPGGPHVLSFLIVGKNAEVLTHLSDPQKVVHVLQELDELYGGQPSRAYTGQHVVQDWTKDPFVGGAYSYPLPGAYRNRGDYARKHLAMALDGRLTLAGEAVALLHPCTVHGAMETAEHAVEQIEAKLR